MDDDDVVREALVVTGPPAAGKSTVSERLASLLSPSAHVSGDLFFGFLRNGAVDPWLEGAVEQNEAVIEAAAVSVGRLVRRFHLVYDGVVGPWYLPTFVGATGLPFVHYAMLLPPLAVCLERVMSRRNHGFRDLEAAERMWMDFQRSITRLEHHVIDALAEPAELAGQIARRVAEGSLRVESSSQRPH